MQNCLLLQRKPALLDQLLAVPIRESASTLCHSGKGLDRIPGIYFCKKKWRKWAKYPLHVLISDVECGQCVEHRPRDGKEDDFLWQASKEQVWALQSCLHLPSLSHIILSIPRKWQETFNSIRTSTNSWKTLLEISYVIVILYQQTFPSSDI